VPKRCDLFGRGISDDAQRPDPTAYREPPRGRKEYRKVYLPKRVLRQ